MSEPRLRLRQSDLFWREIDGQVFALDGRTWDYLNLNESGRMLWDQLVGGATRSQLVQSLVGTYGIDPAVAESDVGAFVEMLYEKKLLDE